MLSGAAAGGTAVDALSSIGWATGDGVGQAAATAAVMVAPRSVVG